MNLLKNQFTDETGTTGIRDNYSIDKYLQSLLDEEISALIKLDYYKGIEKVLKNSVFKKVFEKYKDVSGNKDMSTFAYWKTLEDIKKEVIRRWINAKERNIVK